MAFFKAVKIYYMTNTEKEEPKELRRVKGTSSKAHACFQVGDFTQNAQRVLYANRYRLGPTLGHDIQIAFESRKVIGCLNAKRRCEVLFLFFSYCSIKK